MVSNSMWNLKQVGTVKKTKKINCIAYIMMDDSEDPSFGSWFCVNVWLYCRRLSNYVIMLGWSEVVKIWFVSMGSKKMQWKGFQGTKNINEYIMDCTQKYKSLYFSSNILVKKNRSNCWYCNVNHLHTVYCCFITV